MPTTKTNTKDRLLTVQQAAERLGTSVRFVRTLVAERRIRFVRLGRMIRVPESVVNQLIEQGTVQPVVGRRRGLRTVA